MVGEARAHFGCAGFCGRKRNFAATWDVVKVLFFTRLYHLQAAAELEQSFGFNATAKLYEMLVPAY